MEISLGKEDSVKTVHARELATIVMAAGNESKFTMVIDHGVLKQWVGIGWIEIRPANHLDRETYPTVVRDEDIKRRRGGSRRKKR